MPYTPSWTNGNPQGRLEPLQRVRLSDAQELAAAINRRRLLAYMEEQDFSSQIHSLAPVRSAAVSMQSAPPFDSFRESVGNLLSLQGGAILGQPSSPLAEQWLWPLGGDDENKVIVPGEATPDANEVSLPEMLNGTNQWTDPLLAPGVQSVRAVHFNELRQAVEWMIRGRWTLPIYFPAGILSSMPETPWIGGYVGNTGEQELRTLGFAFIRLASTGLTNVTVRASSRLELVADTDCTIQAAHCLRELDFMEDLPSWQPYRPGLSASWTTPGAMDDAMLLGEVQLTAGQTGVLGGLPLTEGLQAMIDGQAQNFLLRRGDTGGETIHVTGQVVIEFDLNSPPN